MKIVDTKYLVTLSILFIGIPILFILKLYQQQQTPLRITIVGSSLQSSLLIYYLNKLPKDKFNITLVGNMLEKPKSVMDKRMLTFCGIQVSFMKMLKDLQFQYNIQHHGIYYDYKGQRYKIQQQQSFSTIFQYGFSHFTARTKFQNLIQHVKNIKPNEFRQESIRKLLDKLMPDSPQQSGLRYLNQYVGLDQLYLQDYVEPVIKSSYFSSVNSLTLMYKLMPMYCQKSLTMFMDDRDVQQRILSKAGNRVTIIQNLKYYDQRKIINATKDKSDKKSNQKAEILVTLSDKTTSFLTDILIIIEDYQQQKIKQLGYFKSIVDGQLFDDQKYQQQIYTIYFLRKDLRLAVTRLCAKQCRQFRNSVYMVTSDRPLDESNLTMFRHHEIRSQKKKWLLRTNLPSFEQRFQQTQDVYRIHDTEAISDNFQMKLSIFKNMANLIEDKYFKKNYNL